MDEANREYAKSVEGLKALIGVAEISGMGEWTEGASGEEGKKGLDWYYRAPNGKVFLVVRAKTIEVRCDQKLGDVLREDYESVMESRYFGKGGIEIVPSGQLDENELADLVRLSYNLTMKMEE